MIGKVWRRGDSFRVAKDWGTVRAGFTFTLLTWEEGKKGGRWSFSPPTGDGIEHVFNDDLLDEHVEFIGGADD